MAFAAVAVGVARRARRESVIAGLYTRRVVTLNMLLPVGVESRSALAVKLLAVFAVFGIAHSALVVNLLFVYSAGARIRPSAG